MESSYYIERIFTSSYWYHAILSILVPAICVLIFFFALAKYNDSRSILSLIALILSIVLLPGSIIGLLYWREIRANSTEAEKRTATEIFKDTPLYSLANGISIEGQGSTGIFGSFVISSADTYRYYYKEGDRIRQSNVPVSKTYIEYITDENTKPHLVGMYTWPQIICRYNGEERIWDYDSSKETIYVLYVPEGSVVESFELN